MKQTTTGWRERLKDAIERSGKTKQDIAIEAGLGHGYLYGLFKEGKDPSVENLIKICHALGVSPAYVLFGISVTPAQQELLELVSSDPARLRALLDLLKGSAP